MNLHYLHTFYHKQDIHAALKSCGFSLKMISGKSNVIYSCEFAMLYVTVIMYIGKSRVMYNLCAMSYLAQIHTN